GARRSGGGAPPASWPSTRRTTSSWSIRRGAVRSGSFQALTLLAPWPPRSELLEALPPHPARRGDLSTRVPRRAVLLPGRPPAVVRRLARGLPGRGGPARLDGDRGRHPRIGSLGVRAQRTGEAPAVPGVPRTGGNRQPLRRLVVARAPRVSVPWTRRRAVAILRFAVPRDVATPGS